MPVYEYDCSNCGTFSKVRPLAECGLPADCPGCGRSASKLFPLVNLRAMRPENRLAWERNEKSAHAPRQCGTGCSDHGHKVKRESGGSKLVGSKKPNRRPWMLGH